MELWELHIHEEFKNLRSIYDAVDSDISISKLRGKAYYLQPNGGLLLTWFSFGPFFLSKGNRLSTM
jgi:hypothetical protein